MLASSGDREELSSPIDRDHSTTPLMGKSAFEDADDEGEYMHIWTSPDLSNPELIQLLKLFPTFILRWPLPHFPTTSGCHPDIEQGDDEGDAVTG